MSSIHSTCLSRPFALLLGGLLAAASLCASPDPSKVKGPEACGECHKQEVEAWKGTHHFATFNDMHRTDAARGIADKLGIRRIKSESLCLNCHYTEKTMADGSTDVVAGVACESCHGAARDWINIHNDYGTGATKDTEAPEHKQMRWDHAIAGGMLPPTDLYAVAQNCYQCHIVTDEKLVNVGGHATGSADFELVAYSQGEVRHNFFASAGKVNETKPPAHLRKLYVLGAMLDFEYSLRAVARATEKAAYAVTFARRAAAVKARLEKIDSLAPTNEVKAAIAALPDLHQLTLNNSDTLTAAADKVQAAAKAFAKGHDGDDLAPLDSLLPAPDAYKGTTYTPPSS